MKCVKTLNKCTVSLNNFGENLKKCKRESKALKQQNNSITILTAKLKELKATKAVRFARLAHLSLDYVKAFNSMYVNLAHGATTDHVQQQDQGSGRGSECSLFHFCVFVVVRLCAKHLCFPKHFDCMLPSKLILPDSCTAH